MLRIGCCGSGYLGDEIEGMVTSCSRLECNFGMSVVTALVIGMFWIMVFFVLFDG